jgi:hypothetical protein
MKVCEIGKAVAVLLFQGLNTSGYEVPQACQICVFVSGALRGYL